GPCRAGQMGIGLGDAADRPAEVAENLPVGDRLTIHGPASGSLIGGEELFRLADTAEPQVVLTEPPGTHARPGQVFRGIADMRELPIENATQTLGPDHQVANAKITV